MEKIAKTISTCHECEHCKTLHSKDNNYSKAFVCAFSQESLETEHKAFLLEFTEYSGSPVLIIPEECPLEDYHPNIKRNE